MGENQMNSPPTCDHKRRAKKYRLFESSQLEKAPESLLTKIENKNQINLNNFIYQSLQKNQKYNIHSVLKLIIGSFYKWTLLPVSKMHRRTPCCAKWKSRKGGANDRSKRFTISVYFASAPL